MTSPSWTRVGDRGWQCGEYRIGHVFVDGCSLFEVWFGQVLIASKDDFDDALAAARLHAQGAKSA